MSNQSIVSVPPNIEDPVILRRFLTRVVEELDIVLGNRAQAEYVTQESLLTAANNLTVSLEEARITLEKLIEEAEETLLLTEEALQSQVSQNTTDISTVQAAIQDYIAIKAVQLNFTVDGSNNVVHNLDYNIDTTASTRISAGLYEFTLDQATILGNPTVTNSTASLTWDIAVNASSGLYQVVFTEVDGDTFRLQVYEYIVGGGSVLTRQVYDLLPSDTITVTLLFNVPGAGLPPA